MATTHIEGVLMPDVPILLDPSYESAASADSLVRSELVRYDDDRERYERTERGLAKAEAIRASHGLTFVDDTGGGRWHVDGRGLHCGDAIEVLRRDGTWLRTRFEVIFRDHPNAQNGRLPRFHVSMAGGFSLCCEADNERWQSFLCRWPEKKR